ncbi:MAG: DUF58 domain-containing protein [Desulfurococcales archaeon]|nr:DUF58 domain-containing protein [Desulfurococcales archaeon]
MTELVSPSKVLTPLLLLAAISLAATVMGASSVSIIGVTLAGTILGLLMASRYYILLASRMVDDAKFKRLIPEYMVEGTWYEVKFAIDYKRSIPLLLEIHENTPPLVKVEPRLPRFNVIISNTSGSSFSYKVKLPIGRHCFGKTKIIIRDPLGIFRAERNIEIEPSCISAYPKTALLRLPSSLLSLATNRFGGLTKTRKKGVGTEYYDTREYRVGDEIKHIEWKATARTGKLMIKEFEMETANYVFLIGLLGREMMAGPLGKTVFEYTARSIGAISKYLLDKGDYVGLLTWQPRETNLVRLKRGKKHHYEILKTLGNLKWVTEEEPTVAAEVVDLLRKQIPTILPRDRVIVIVFASLVKDLWTDELIDFLFRVKMLKNDVIVIAPNPRFFEAEALSGLDAVIYKLKLIELVKETEAIRRKLLQKGVTVTEVGPRDYVETVLMQIEMMRQFMQGGSRG